jgi:hypothetical protein
MLQYYNLMGPPSYMRSVVDRTVIMRRIPVYGSEEDGLILEAAVVLVVNGLRS